MGSSLWNPLPYDRAVSASHPPGRQSPALSGATHPCWRTLAAGGADHPPICTRRGPFPRPEGSVQGERRRKNLTKKQVQVIIAF